MPVIVNSKNIHPFLPSLGSLAAIEQTLAEKQDIRPLEIAIINLMADKQTTERQLAFWLGHTPLQVKLTFAATDSYIHSVRNGRETKNTPSDHIHDFYNAWSDIKANKYDGLIVTGVNALQERVEQEAVWPEVEEIFAWSLTNVFSSLYLCWGAKAGLKYFHDIDSVRQNQKIWGVFKHHVFSDKTKLLSGFADAFDLPVSRWKTPSKADILKHEALEIVADSEEVGPNVLVESAFAHSGETVFPRRVYVLAHPEYETASLLGEYLRDRASAPNCPVPRHYFTDDDPAKEPINTWRPCAHLYTNWVHAIYDAAPYVLSDIPNPYEGR